MRARRRKILNYECRVIVDGKRERERKKHFKYFKFNKYSLVVGNEF